MSPMAFAGAGVANKPNCPLKRVKGRGTSKVSQLRTFRVITTARSLRSRRSRRVDVTRLENRGPRSPTTRRSWTTSAGTVRSQSTRPAG
jgi:hypothetical protein